MGKLRVPLRKAATGGHRPVFEPPPAAVFEPLGGVMRTSDKDRPETLLAVMDAARRTSLYCRRAPARPSLLQGLMFRAPPLRVLQPFPNGRLRRDPVTAVVIDDPVD